MEKEFVLRKGTLLFKDKYEIEDVISTRGGTGFTYRAKNKADNQIVALKEFFPKGFCARGINNQVVVADLNKEDQEIFDNSKAMFEREANLLKENQEYGVILKFYDVFKENNTVYFAMEYLSGETLKEYLKKHGGKLSLEETFKIMQPVFDSMITLHRMNIWHRDISPDNIFICKNGKVRLIDFGNSRLGIKGNSRIVDWAKPGYSAYEQENETLRQGTWSDVYSMAATFYNCISGEEPLNARERAVKKETMRSPKELGCDIDIALDDAIMKGLEVYPEQRYQTILEFKQAIFPYRMTKPVEHKENTSNEKKEKVSYCGYIQGLEGFFKGQTIKFEEKKLTLGRRPEQCDLVFPADTAGVSGVHCSLEWDKEHGVAYITDQNSTYGTRYLNQIQMAKGQRIMLDEGQGFIIGDNEIFVVIKELAKK